jgi:hypothetical protein
MLLTGRYDLLFGPAALPTVQSMCLNVRRLHFQGHPLPRVSPIPPADNTTKSWLSVYLKEGLQWQGKPFCRK